MLLLYKKRVVRLKNGLKRLLSVGRFEWCRWKVLLRRLYIFSSCRKCTTKAGKCKDSVTTNNGRSRCCCSTSGPLGRMELKKYERRRGSRGRKLGLRITKNLSAVIFRSKNGTLVLYARRILRGKSSLWTGRYQWRKTIRYVCPSLCLCFCKDLDQEGHLQSL